MLITTRPRAARMAHFWRLFESHPPPDQPLGAHRHILDLGGVGAFWAEHGLDEHPSATVTAINLEPHPPDHLRVMAQVGDACDLSAWVDRSVEIVFSNSVIEHLGGAVNQSRFAREARRVGGAYFIQTPNRYFPMEPHYMIPGFQFFPMIVCRWLVVRRAWGHMPRIPNPNEAERSIRQIQLLSARDLQGLFPDAHIHHERFAGLSKSLLAIGGTWNTNPHL